MNLITRQDAITEIRRIMNTFDIPSVEDNLRIIMGTECCCLEMNDGEFHLIDQVDNKTIVQGETLPDLFAAFNNKFPHILRD